MSEQQKEMLSALFDGEATEFEVRRQLQALQPEDCQRWQRYQLLRDAASGKLHETNLAVSVADAVSAALADEPVLNPQPATSAVASAAHSPARGGWKKPLLGFAVAASVSFVAILAVLQSSPSPEGATGGFVANGNVSASRLAISADAGQAGNGFSNVSGTVASASLQREINAINAQKQQERERLRYYLQVHAQNASFSNGRGLMPMARTAEEEDN